MAASPFSYFKRDAGSEKSLSLEQLQGQLTRKLILWLWQSGLGNAINFFPKIFGSHMVVIFPDSNQMLPLTYTEAGEEILALVQAADCADCANALVSNPIVQVWMKNGWFTAQVAFLQDHETLELMRVTTPEQFYGKAGVALRSAESGERIRALQIRKVAACTGEKGPGQYAWIWAAAAFFFFFSWLFKRKK